MRGQVLLVEDDQFKQRALSEYLKTEFGVKAMTIARSVVGAVDAIDAGDVALVVLDLAIPNYDNGGDASTGLGGVTVFRYLQQVASTVPVIVITQFEALNEGDRVLDIVTIRQNLSDEFGGQFLGLVQYRPSVGNWKEEVKKIFPGE